jgi:hypothetical protein
MTDLLEGDAEAMPENVHVVARLLGGIAEEPIRHQDGSGEIVGERRPHQRCGFRAGELAGRDDPVDGVVEAEKRDLVGDLEKPARRRQHLGYFQAA